MSEHVTVTWTPADPAGVPAQKRMAAENIGDAPSEADAVLLVVQPNGDEAAWTRAGRRVRPIPPRP